MKITIGGYRVDNVEWFKEHEGFDAFKCDIFYGDKKIGNFSQNYWNGPDEYTFKDNYDEKLNSIRETANAFFKKYSKEDELFTTEDFFIRFLQSLKDGCDLAKIGEDIVISTSYPYDYKIYKTLNKGNGVFVEDEDIKLKFQVKSENLNISIKKLEKNKEESYGLD